MATLFPGMRMPSAITNMFEDIRDAALKGSILGSMLVAFETTNGVGGTLNFPGEDKTIKSEADLVTVLNKKVATVGNLQKLKIESLQPFDFRLKALPQWFSAMSSLRELRLIHHRLNKLVPEELIRGLTKLQILELSTSSVDELPNCIGELTALTVLNVSENNLFAMPPSLTLLTNLRELDISRNPLEKWVATVKGIPALLKLEKLIVANTGMVDPPAAASLTQLKNLSYLDASGNRLWNIKTDLNISTLTSLNLRDNQLRELQADSLPQGLKFLDLSKNKLSSLPPALQALSQLQTLRIASNAIAELPEEIDTFQMLTELDVSNNALEKIPSTLGTLQQLRVLNASGNTLKSLPSTIGHCKSLLCVNVDANPKLKLLPRSFDSLDLDEFVVAGIKTTRSQKQSGQLGGVVMNAETTETHSPNVMRKQLVQLVHMARTSHNPLVVYALASKATDDAVADFVVEEGALEDLVTFCTDVPSQSSTDDENWFDASDLSRSRMSGSSSSLSLSNLVASSVSEQLREISLEALSRLSQSDTIRLKLIRHEKELVPMLSSLLRHPHRSNKSHVAAALYIVGNLALSVSLRKSLVSFGVVEKISPCLQSQHSEVVDQARRALSAFGENALISKPMQKRGVRILALDGGGSRGVATVAMLAEIEAKTGRKLNEMFDLIAGVSTGSIIAALSTVKKLSTTEISAFYREMCGKVFSNPRNPTTEATGSDNRASANYVLTQAYTSWAKVLSYSSLLKQGTLYQTKQLEELIQQVTGKDRMIDTAGMTDTKLVILSSLVSRFPPQTYVIRNYNYPPDVESSFPGSSEMLLWQAIRASSAAPVFFDDCTIDDDKFVDGGFMANNPSAVALSEAKKLWPDREIDLLLSVGTGRRVPTVVAKSSTPSLISLATSLVESATDPEKIHQVLEITLPKDKYFRLQPVHQVYECELDETRPEKLDEMQRVAVEYFTQTGLGDKISTILSNQ